MSPKILLASLFLLAFIVPAAAQRSAVSRQSAQKSAAAATAKSTDLLADVMDQELNRAATELAKSENPPYFTSYSVDDLDETVIIGSNGAILISNHPHRRLADVSLRVGRPAPDNTLAAGRRFGITNGVLPLADGR